MCTCVSTCHICVTVYERVYKRTCVCARVWQCAHKYMHMTVCMCMFVSVYECHCPCLHEYICIRVCMCVSVFVCIIACEYLRARVCVSASEFGCVSLKLSSCALYVRISTNEFIQSQKWIVNLSDSIVRES